ncbi:helix-turn-helix transcriptional regulator [Spirosoma montaniterrae]|uniref:XRE family transcriptional regulator n=1 Tax=Spirosoma montaniterrae TaxID=1178516 RepID=A0A1P9WV23_9BACT|nr:helix-turn-helix transcriptional regulator [Spirosoma montaniterrae]AQG79224.1 XRE family transcriptional regulator [Spirosoma montaniterrae]
MNINDKIKQILIDKNLTPSYFADEIGVQRSSISHILSGRNRPSFDIIQKIIRRFPDLGYEWIMEEEPAASAYSGRVPGMNRVPTPATAYPYPHPQVQSPQPAVQPAVTRVQRSEIPPVMMAATPADFNPETTAPAAIAEKRVERILVFYTDGSFREYMPDK